MKRLLSGLQPTGNLSIGNYCGAVRQFIAYQDMYESFLFVPDMHTITTGKKSEALREKIMQVIGLYLACGLDPGKNVFYIQSENLYHANLSWILECHSYMGELSRMTQFKEKGKNSGSVTCGLFTYPVLMAADILLYSADYVPTGEDQKQHVELARDLAIRFNRIYGDVFTVPEPLIPNIGARIKDLQDPGKKMSKSDENTKGIVFLMDPAEDIKKKIMTARTDSEAKIYFDEVKKPEISNLLTIYSVFADISIDDTVALFSGTSYKAFKSELADLLVRKLTCIQENYYKIMAEGSIDGILNKGLKYTESIAKMKYEEVRNKIGLGR